MVSDSKKTSKSTPKQSGVMKQALPKEALEIVASRFRAMGDATRLELLQCLMNGEHSVQELCNLTGLSQANVSKHLSLLADQGILNRRKQGLYVYYSVADTSIYQLCDLVCGSLSKRFSKVQQHFAS